MGRAAPSSDPMYTPPQVMEEGALPLTVCHETLYQSQAIVNSLLTVLWPELPATNNLLTLWLSLVTATLLEICLTLQYRDSVSQHECVS